MVLLVSYSAARGSDDCSNWVYKHSTNATEPSCVSGNWDAKTQGTPLWCKQCARLPAGLTGLPILPLSQATSVTMGGMYFLSSVLTTNALVSSFPSAICTLSLASPFNTNKNCSAVGSLFFL